MGKSNKIMITVLLVVMTLSTGACSPSASPSEPSGGGGSAPAAGTSKVAGVEVAKQTGGKLNMVPGGVVFGNPNDPHLVVTGAGRVYSMPVTNYLLMRDLYDEKFPIVGDLAKSWEVSKDGLSYTFKLHEGVKFHNVPPVNGREFTSEDAKYAFLRITADPSVIVEKWKPRFQRRIDFGQIESIDTPDKYTVTVNLKEPFAPFLDSVSHPGTQILPREFIEKFPDKIITEGMIGTGPFIPTEYKNQVIASFKRNPDYWKKDSEGSQLPYLDELHYLYFADVQSQLAAFRSGQLDVATPGATRSNLDPIKRDLPQTKVYLTPSANIANFRFNVKFKPFQDVKVRQAIHLAIDRHQFLELIVEGMGSVSGPITPTFSDLANTMDWLLQQPGYRKDNAKDLEDAKRLLQEAGYGDGFTMKTMFSSGGTSGDVASLLQDQLKPLKITQLQSKKIMPEDGCPAHRRVNLS